MVRELKKSRLRTKRFSHHFWGILVSDLGDFRSEFLCD
ncbi:DUF1661 domain-containing protein [Porphyromonas gingivalis]|nr:DUF1661 domain-containing protein [Porphyromonas gingivalis]MCE8174407.1 DUF1661 domain-containing protein [Porphyromonas gingivalis]MCE8175723.1 DUF1661 domain-containing protein [Porphyromonas gingivalis]